MVRAELVANRRPAGVGYIWCFAPGFALLDDGQRETFTRPVRLQRVGNGSSATGWCRLLFKRYWQSRLP